MVVYGKGIYMYVSTNKTTKFQYLFIKMKNKELLLLDKKVTISIYGVREKSD